MDKMTFANFKFKPSDVINGLNRYFAETKANRYFRASLTIRNGVCFNNPDCVKDIIFTNSLHDWNTKSGRVRWNYYLLCDPDEVVGVAINWLREEHDIFYTPGMEVPKKDCDIFCEEKLDTVPVAKVREALGIGEDSDIFQCIKYRNNQLETLRTELAASRRMYRNSIEERNKFGRRLADIRKAAGMADDDQTDLVRYIETLRKYEEEYEYLYKQYEKMYCELRDAKFTKLYEERDHYKRLYESLNYEILKVYREIFDCSNGDPEGTDEETLQDILTEYKRCLELKDAAEEKAINYKELAKEKDQWKRKAEDTNAGWEADRWMTNRLLNEQRDFIKTVAEILDVKDPYIESEYKAAISKLRTTVAHPNRYKWLYENLKNGVESVLQEAEEKED